MNNYNYFNRQNPFQGQGTQYSDVKQAGFTNPLTEAQRKLLATNAPAFSLEIDDVELATCMCTHKDPVRKTYTITADGVCSICGKKVDPNAINYTATDVENAVNVVLSILEATKLYYMDIPEEMGKQYFPIIAYLKRLPKLYQISVNNFKKYERVLGIEQPGGNNSFGVYNAILGGAIPQNCYTNPLYGYQPQAQPQYMQSGYQQAGYPQPGYAQGYAQPGYQPPQPGGNPFGAECVDVYQMQQELNRLQQENAQLKTTPPTDFSPAGYVKKAETETPVVKKAFNI